MVFVAQKFAKLCRNSANAVFRLDNVFVNITATLRPKFRQRGRLLVPVYKCVRNAGELSF